MEAARDENGMEGEKEGEGKGEEGKRNGI